MGNRWKTTRGMLAPAPAGRKQQTAHPDQPGSVCAFKGGTLEEHGMRTAFKGWKFLLSAALVGVLAAAGTAAASSSYRTAMRTAYPAIVGSRIDNCMVCHQTTTGSPSSPRNAYGLAYAAAQPQFHGDQWGRHGW